MQLVEPPRRVKSTAPGPQAVFSAPLADAASAARQALDATRPQHMILLDVLARFETAVRTQQVESGPEMRDDIREMVESFRGHYDALRSRLEALIDVATNDLTSAFEDLERDSALVTIMLFGRTKAGKSTTMEALTGGDGRSMGMGRQHTTTEICSYTYPRPADGQEPAGPALRIVDTPGVEGFDGDALAEMAERYVERSDHIFFLISDDKASPEELDRFGIIRTQGKGITVLLNVKAKDEDLDLLLADPEYTFRPKDLAEHEARIRSYLQTHFDIPSPRIIPFHARGAWLSGSAEQVPGGLDPALLRKHSRIADIERRIADFIAAEARLARIKAPRDLVLGYVVSLKDELRPVAGQFRRTMRHLDTLGRQLQDGTHRARQRIKRRFPDLRNRFQAVNDAIPAMLDEIIASGGRGSALQDRWQRLLQEHGVSDAVDWFVEAGRQDFREELDAEVAAIGFAFDSTEASGIDDELEAFYGAAESEKRNRFTRASLRTAGSVGTAALVGWAIVNFWNPSGWLAAAGAVATVGAGLAGEALARTATDEWERASKKEMYEKRSIIIARLRDRLWTNYGAARRVCGDWLDEAKAQQIATLNQTARPVQRASRALWQAVVDALNELDTLADRLNEGLVRDLLAAVVPECRLGAVEVRGVARATGHRTKILVAATRPGVNAVAACIGRQGAHVQLLKEALTGEGVDLVDADAPPDRRMIQALGLHRHAEASVVTATSQDGTPTATVRLNTPSHRRTAIGFRGQNIRLASRLTGVDITIAET